MIENYAISVIFVQKFSVVTSKSDSKFKIFKSWQFVIVS
jgi:hypothetical protein